MGHQHYFHTLPVIFIVSTVLFSILDRSLVESMKKLGNFRIFWNVPTFMCRKYGYNFSTVKSEWGIIQNNNDQFRGDEISILYDPGLFPALLNTTPGSRQQLRNGGVPQEGKLNLHLDRLQYDIERQIPDKNFRGLSIIDFEHWRPIWRENWGSLNSYRGYSRAIERRIHPWWSDSMIEKEAANKFEKAAKDFMGESLRLAKLMRPLAKWGYYGYPFCFNYTPNNNKSSCSEEVVHDNNRFHSHSVDKCTCQFCIVSLFLPCAPFRPCTPPHCGCCGGAIYATGCNHVKLKWLFEDSTALFPSMYLRNLRMTSATRAKFILGRMEEATRLSEKHSDKPVYAYTWYKYPDVGRYLSQDDLMNSFEIPKKMGANGVIIWGATNDVNSKVNCAGLYDYLQRILGPVVQQIKKKMRSLNSLDYENDIILDHEYNEIDSMFFV